MVESRWLRWVGPGVIALGAVGFIASTTLGARDRPWVPRACAGSAGAPVAAHATVAGGLAELRADARWFRLDPLLDATGALPGQRLSIGLDGEPAPAPATCQPSRSPPARSGASSWSGPMTARRRASRRSTSRGGCSWPVADERDVIRRATIDPAGAFVYEMRVDRAGRADLGIWRRPIDGTSRPLAASSTPLAADPRFGRTFSTEFTWDIAGRPAGRPVMRRASPAGRASSSPATARGPCRSTRPTSGSLVGLDGDRAVTLRGLSRASPARSSRPTFGPVDASPSREDGGPAVAAPDAGRSGASSTRRSTGTARRLRSVALDGRRPDRSRPPARRTAASNDHGRGRAAPSRPAGRLGRCSPRDCRIRPTAPAPPAAPPRPGRLGRPAR